MPRVARAYLLSIAIWGALSLLNGWEYRIFDRELNVRSSFFDMVLLAESRGLTFALLTPPIFFVVRRYINSIEHPFRYFFFYALGVVPFMFLYACIRWTIFPPWDTALQQYVPRASRGPLELIRSGFADQITIYIAIVVAAHAYEYFERARRQELEKSEFQQALTASELQALKMQLHPHFLFNTLHGISTLIDSDPANAKAMIVKLSSLLRAALQHTGSDLVPLEMELKFVQEYLDLEKMRLGARLRIIWLIDDETYHILVPQFILQPLVENAIRHGIACLREGGWIEISSTKQNDILELRVRNSTGISLRRGSGVGLRNTAARLNHLYSEEATMAFEIDRRHIATATLRVPVLGFFLPAIEEQLSPSEL
jgi:two-component system, LytTR family, sensor kinase